MATRKMIHHDEFVKKHLKTKASIESYLNEALEDDDPRVFLLALKDVVIARGGFSKISKQTNLSRESMYKTLSTKGNPTFKSLNKLVDTVGFQISIKPKKSVRKPTKTRKKVLA
ncbi:putative addiction module antidote protein [bacterium AH-315-C08]|nr:putative addiction module antidote protein [bacterium AH-315-C08]